jgi:hypothetical protein
VLNRGKLWIKGLLHYLGKGYSPSSLCLTDLELPSIGWQLFILDSSQSDPIALPAFLDTYATRLLTEPLIHRSAWKGNSQKFTCRIVYRTLS